MASGWRRAFCTSIRRDPTETAATNDYATISSPSSSFNNNKKQCQKNEEEEEQQVPTPVKSKLLGRSIGSFFVGGGGSSNNPSTPRKLHSSSSSNNATPKINLQCKTSSTNAAATNTHDDTRKSTTTKSKSKSKSNNNSNNDKESPRPQQSPSLKSPSRFALFKTALRLSRNRCGICGESVSQRTAAIFTAECSHSFHFTCISAHVRRTQDSLVCPVCSATWRHAPLLSSSSSITHPGPDPDPDPDPDPAAGSPGGSQNSSNSERSNTSSRGRRQAKVATSKIYDDDESLQQPSPTSQSAGGMMQFNPIPEELEEDEDDNELGCINNMEKLIGLELDSVALISTGHCHLNYVVSIKMEAPRLPPRPHTNNNNNTSCGTAGEAIVPPGLLDHPSCRAPIDLVTVLDVSGNMTVEKLQMLKRAMRSVISSMGPGDRLSIVAYSIAAAKRLLPLRRMSRLGQRSARQIVDRLVVCGSNQAQSNSNQYCSTKSSSSSPNCMGNALRKATKVLEDRRERNPVATIMLLSDGQSQEQQCQQQRKQQDQIVHDGSTMEFTSQNQQQLSSATRFMHIEIPIHASEGLKDHMQVQYQKKMNSNVPMYPLAMDEEENVFAKHVNGLVSVVLQDLNLQFTLPPTSGGAISSVYSFSTTKNGNTGGDDSIGQAISHGEGGKFVCLGDLYAEEERQLLVEIKVPKTAVVGGNVISSLQVACSYRDPLTREVIHRGEKPLNLPNTLPLYQSKNQSQQHHFPKLLRSSSSSSSSRPTTPSSLSAAEATLSSHIYLQQQQQLRNLFVTTRAMSESRHLVELSDIDTAIHLLSSARSLLFQQTTASISNINKKLLLTLEAELEILQKQQKQRKMQYRQQRSLSPSLRNRSSEHASLLAGGEREPLTPTSAWRAAEQLAKVAIMRKSLNRVSDLHGFENARF